MCRRVFLSEGLPVVRAVHRHPGGARLDRDPDRHPLPSSAGLQVGAVWPERRRASSAASRFLKPMQAEQLEQAQMVASLAPIAPQQQRDRAANFAELLGRLEHDCLGRRLVGKGIFFFLVLLSNAMMATLVCVTLSRRLFYEGWSRNHSQGDFQLGVPLLDRPDQSAAHRPLPSRIVNFGRACTMPPARSSSKTSASSGATPPSGASSSSSLACSVLRAQPPQRRLRLEQRILGELRLASSTSAPRA